MKLIIKVQGTEERTFSNHSSTQTIKDFIEYIDSGVDYELKKKFYDSINKYHEFLSSKHNKNNTRIYMDLVEKYVQKPHDYKISELKEILESELIKESARISEQINKTQPAKYYKNLYISSSKKIVLNEKEKPEGHCNFLKNIFHNITEFEFLLSYTSIPNEEPKQKDIKKQIIFFGPPGTGKSEHVKKISLNFHHVFRTTFHPEYNHLDFVGQYRPIIGYQTNSHRSLENEQYEFNNQIIKGKRPIVLYDFIPGIFIKSLLKSYKNPNDKVLLIIEEINRGNCSAIFGDIFQLLDRNQQSFESEFPIEMTEDIFEFLKNQLNMNDYSYKIIKNRQLYIPSNLSILATMNTSDQSLFPIDSAFKRRWDMKYVPIDYNNKDLYNSYFVFNDKKYSWIQFLRWINKKINKIYNAEDKQIGQWFSTFSKDSNNNLFFNEDVFKHKILSYLFFDVFRFQKEQLFKVNSFSEILDKKDLNQIFIDFDQNLILQ